MPVINTKVTVPAGEVSGWIDTDGVSNIIVGVSGRGYKLEYNLGSGTVYTNNISHEPGSGAITVVKAFQIRIRNSSKAPLSFEVFG